MSKLLTVREVAEWLGISWRSVLRHAEDGKFPWGLKIGGARRWRAESVTRYLDEQEKQRAE